MKKIGIIVGILMCILIVSTTAVSAAAPMDEDVKPKDGPCTVGDESSSCTSDCGSEDDAPSQEPSTYLIYFSK
jgi:hypothetical protein